ncbi:hypothetical protein F8M41_019422 [Gigaspora margarita]|uniref:Uncharacterized protein n=1 Tax=Gigaspora margarita TaxID=4874 RepID=A0A8H4B2F4_GIGMA|nr:hypothetical protein F8M41_019422 [Gigaspora margarita]
MINDKLDNTNIDIEKELGVMMFPADLISKHFNGGFPVASIKDVHINIIVQAPITVGFSQQVRSQVQCLQLNDSSISVVLYYNSLELI